MIESIQPNIHPSGSPRERKWHVLLQSGDNIKPGRASIVITLGVGPWRQESERRQQEGEQCARNVCESGFSV
jgi:hypothetical protein